MSATASWKILSVALAVLVASIGTGSVARSAELVMFERAGCIWCQRWNRDIAPVYDKTDEAKLLPLRRIDIGRNAPTGLTLASPVIYTPTFVVIDRGREIGRITGYINDDAFWGLLGTLAAKLQPVPDHT